MTAKPGKQIIAIDILTNISRKVIQSDHEIWSVNRM